MGIKYNYEIFAGCGKEISLNQLNGKSIAIDMMTYVVRYYKMFSANKWYAKVIEFIRKIQDHKIRCLCVFDGYNKPPEKKICVRKRREISDKYKQELKRVEEDIESLKTGIYEDIESRQRDYDTLCYRMRRAKMNCSYPTSTELFHMIILLEELLGCETYIADGEAESLCCWFVKNNEADYVLSEDSDVLLYNIDSFIAKYSHDTGKAKLYTIEEILLRHNITFEELFYLCLMMGTDYNTGFAGCGFKTGLKKIKKEGIINIKKKLEEEKDQNGKPNSSCERLKTLFEPNGIFQKPKYDLYEKRRALRVLC